MLRFNVQRKFRHKQFFVLQRMWQYWFYFWAVIVSIPQAVWPSCNQETDHNVTTRPGIRFQYRKRYGPVATFAFCAVSPTKSSLLSFNTASGITQLQRRPTKNGFAVCLRSFNTASGNALLQPLSLGASLISI